MRVLLTIPTSNARLHNMVPLAWALRTSGHEVQVACRPGYASAVNRTGMVAVAVGEDVTSVDDWLTDQPAVDALVRYAGLWKPDIVIWDQRAPAGAVAARVTGAVSIRMRGTLDHTTPSEVDRSE